MEKSVLLCRTLCGQTPMFTSEIAAVEGTRGTETSKYPEENKLIKISSVAVSESETA